MLPPESTATTGVPKCCGWSSTAATAAAPAGSTTSLARSTRASTARDSESSETVSISSTWSRTAANGRSPGRPTAMPSAIVFIEGSCCGRPASSEGGYAAAPAACTPTTRTSGRLALTAIATPASRPPPPVGTITVCTSGACSSTSSPSVPAPLMMSTWSNGWISTAPVSSANRRAAASDSSSTLPSNTTSAPYARVARSLGIGAPFGHEHRGVDAEELRRERDALGVVAGRGGDDAAGALLRREPGDPGERTAGLEGAGALQVLGLERDRAADQRGQPAGLLHRRLDRDLADQLAGRLDVGEGHRARGHRDSGRRGQPPTAPSSPPSGLSGTSTVAPVST